jgi:16S rRNA C1402 (ribose-2'-O) methylase RsmI
MLLDRLLAPLRAGHDVGLLSEAGCPAVADPGANLVALAQREDIRIVPLIGPSSLLLALDGIWPQWAALSLFRAICQPRRAER